MEGAAFRLPGTLPVALWTVAGSSHSSSLVRRRRERSRSREDLRSCARTDSILKATHKAAPVRIRCELVALAALLLLGLLALLAAHLSHGAPSSLWSREALRAADGRLSHGPAGKGRSRGATQTSPSAAHATAGSSRPLALAVLGEVFDVRADREIFARGGSFRALVGREVARALATGDQRASAPEGIEGLPAEALAAMVAWREALRASRPSLGRARGAFYDEDGLPTADLALAERAAAEEARAPARATPAPRRRAQDPLVPSACGLADARATCSPGAYPRRIAGPSLGGALAERCGCFSAEEPTPSRRLFPGCEPSASVCELERR